MDWENHDYRIACDNLVPVGFPVHLTNGNGAVTGSAAGSTDYDQFTVAYLQDVSGDLTGDGQPETVVMLGCTPQPSNFSVFEVQVFTASHTLLAELPSPATLKPPNAPLPPEYDAHMPMTIQGGILSCRMLFYTATDTHASGPSQPQTVQWRWNGQQFSRVG